MDNTVCGRCSVSKITQFRRCIFSKNIYSFCHLKLEIALAIPASNDEKYNWNNSAGQGLSCYCCCFSQMSAADQQPLLNLCSLIKQAVLGIGLAAVSPHLQRIPPLKIMLSQTSQLLLVVVYKLLKITWDRYHFCII